MRDTTPRTRTFRIPVLRTALAAIVGLALPLAAEGRGEGLPGGRFRQEVTALIRFTTPPSASSPGFEAGTQTITQAVTLTGRDALESTGTTAFFTREGNRYREGCSVATGQRLR